MSDFLIRKKPSSFWREKAERMNTLLEHGVGLEQLKLCFADLNFNEFDLCLRKCNWKLVLIANIDKIRGCLRDCQDLTTDEVLKRELLMISNRLIPLEDNLRKEYKIGQRKV